MKETEASRPVAVVLPVSEGRRAEQLFTQLEGLRRQAG